MEVTSVLAEVAWTDTTPLAAAASSEPVIFAELAPAAMVTEEGNFTEALLQPNRTVTPPAGAGLASCTARVKSCPGRTCDGERESFASAASPGFTGTGRTAIVACIDFPSRVAVITTVVSAVTEPAWSWTDAEAEPSGTITAAGAAITPG